VKIKAEAAPINPKNEATAGVAFSSASKTDNKVPYIVWSVICVGLNGAVLWTDFYQTAPNYFSAW
jgi:hypothetical protein